MQAEMITDGKPFTSLGLVTGASLEGPWYFYSQGTIGAYPGFVNDKRDYVPITAVVVAVR